MKIPTRILAMGLTVSAFMLLPQSSQAAPPRLLPFQGRLTDASGTPVPDGAKVVQFKIYDAPTGGTALWPGEVQKLTVNGGLVSTLLGSKADLSAVDFNNPLFLEITVDANADSQITAADPPLLPRQTVLPAVFAVEAQTARALNGHPAAEYEAIFSDNNPATGTLNGGKIKAGSLPGSAIVGESIDGGHIAAGTLTSIHISPQAVRSEEIEDGTIQAIDLSSALRQGVTPAGTISATILDAPPPGWLMCDGHEELVSDHPVLATALGSKFGVSSVPTGPSAKFRLPDLRGLFLRGRNGDRLDSLADPDSGSSSTQGADGKRFALLPGGATGDQVGSHQISSFEAHTHSSGSLAALVYISGNQNVYIRQRSVNAWNSQASANGGARGNEALNSAAIVVGETGWSLRKSTTMDPARPANAATETRPANVSVNYIIKF